jgi:signal peptidase complex subunit 1
LNKNRNNVQYPNSHGACVLKLFLSLETNDFSPQDFDGQARAEKISRAIITVFGFVGLVFGAVIQQFSQTIYILAAGFALALIITIPPYPLYRKKPLNWQKSRNNNTSEGEGSSKKTKSK